MITITNKITLLICLLGILVILSIISIYNIDQTTKIETMINMNIEQQGKPQGKPTWHVSNCPNKLLEVQKKIIDETNNINSESKISVGMESEFFIPCSYNLINYEIAKLPKTENGKYFIIDGADEISAKNSLWVNIVLHHGMEKAKILSPETFVFSQPQDIERLKKNHKDGKIYIMKKNIQRQQGLLITDDLDKVINDHKGYVIVQELMQNPYTIKGRKINLRVYVLVVCQKNNMDVYLYNDGFMYYTPEKFVKGSIEDKFNITTGYVDRWIYKVHPLTHTDFKAYLDSERNDLLTIENNIRKQGLLISDIVFNRINKLISDVFVCFKGKSCKTGTKLCNNITYQLFGADVSINNKLVPQIIEINKGPDLGAKDERDGKIKTNLMRDIYKIMGGIKNNGNDFIKVLEIENNKIILS